MFKYVKNHDSTLKIPNEEFQQLIKRFRSDYNTKVYELNDALGGISFEDDDDIQLLKEWVSADLDIVRLEENLKEYWNSIVHACNMQEYFPTFLY
jgi:hypothetical protein